MIQYDWNNEKNEILKKQRGISFEQVVLHIEKGDILQHPNSEKYPNQKIIIINIIDYIYVVPFVESDNIRFLKTIIPNRKLNINLRRKSMDKFKFDDEEKDLLESLDLGEWNSVDILKDEILDHIQVAKNTLKKDKRVNIRLTSRDLEGIQTRALEDGIPYQTLMASILHKYVNGRLVEKSV